MAGTDWQNYTAPSGGPAADDTLLELDVSDDSASADGTVHQATVAAVVQAGMGLTTQGDLAVGGSGGVPQRLAAGPSGDVLTSNGAGAVPSWQAASGGLSNPMSAVGDLIVGGTSGAPARLAAGTANYVLTAHGAATAPTWAAATGGSTPITTEGDLVVGGSGGTPQRLAAGTSGYVLTTHGAGALPTWAAASGGTGAVTYISPTGDTTGAQDKLNINTALTSTGIVNLVPGGHYYINGPIVIPGSLCRISGGWPYGAAQNDTYGAGQGQPGGTLIISL